MLFPTAPLPIVDVLADANHYGGTRVSYEFIVLHHTGGKDSRLWLSKTSKPPVSVHRLISRTGTIYKIVNDKDVAWGQGFGYMGGKGYYHSFNERSLSIELENLGNGEEYPFAQLLSAAKQVVEWYGSYYFPTLLYHYMIDPNKSDPAYFPHDIFKTLIKQELSRYL